MAITLKASTIRTFYFNQIDDGTLFGKLQEVPLSDPHEGYISFRQATTSDVERRTLAISKRMYRPEGESLTIVDETNSDYIARLEVMLTLSGTDILFPDGGELDFVNNRIKSENQFNKWWDQMPPRWAREVHRCCLEVNLDWNPKRDILG